MRTPLCLWVLAACVAVLIATSTQGSAQSPPAVVGLTTTGAVPAISARLDVPAGSSITALRWYNNDEDAVFPSVLVVGGTPAGTPNLADTLCFAQAVRGVSDGWARMTFEGGFPAPAEGAFVVFVFPADVTRTGRGLGGGPGVGLTTDTGAGRVAITADGINWARATEAYKLAVTAEASPGAMGLASQRRGLVIQEEPSSPQQPSATTALLPPARNPVTGDSPVVFHLANPGSVRIQAYNVRGQRVATLHDGRAAAGSHTLHWPPAATNGAPVANGVYFLRMEAEGKAFTQRITVLR